MSNATQPLTSNAAGGKNGGANISNDLVNQLNSKNAAGNVDTLKNQAAAPTAQYQTTPAIPGSIFGNAVTEPAIISTMNDKISDLQNSVATNQSDLAAAQAAYNKLAKQKVAQTISTPVQRTGITGALLNGGGGVWGALGKISSTNPAYTKWQEQLSAQSKKVNDLKAQLSKNQTDLQKAISRQADLNAAGRDAVSWGLAAKAAEENGLRNAMQAYQQGMANAGVRNAIMNAAINTVGNGGGGK